MSLYYHKYNIIIIYYYNNNQEKEEEVVILMHYYDSHVNCKLLCNCKLKTFNPHDGNCTSVSSLRSFDPLFRKIFFWKFLFFLPRIRAR
jgi:hypothetical protein